jgi:hypothetical protein
MPPELRSPSSRDSFLEAVHSEIIAGSENLAAWIKQVQCKGAIESLFGLETWLKGLRSFFNPDHLPLSAEERNQLVTRSFAPEIGIVRQAIQICEACACAIMKPDIGGEFKFEEFVEIQMRRDRILDFHISRMLEQLTPKDSVSRLLEFLNDFRITVDAFKEQPDQGYRLFLSLGRSYGRELKSCRYVDMLMSQRFKLQYDIIENDSLVAVLRRIPEDPVRRNLSLALLYLFRFLKYLKLVSADLAEDRPLKRQLVIFALLHEEMGNLADFFRTRLLRNREVGRSLQSAAELVTYSLKMEAQRVIDRELIQVSHEIEASPIYTRIENSHGLLRNCCQSCILTLIQAIDESFDAAALFPSRTERLVEGEKLRADLWALRHWLTDVLANREELDSGKIIMRLDAFKDASLRSLMYRDWAEFEAFSDALAVSNNFIEIRTQVRKFVGFLETLIQEVSKRSIFQEKQPAS